MDFRRLLCDQLNFNTRLKDFTKKTLNDLPPELEQLAEHEQQLVVRAMTYVHDDDVASDPAQAYADLIEHGWQPCRDEARFLRQSGVELRRGRWLRRSPYLQTRIHQSYALVDATSYDELDVWALLWLYWHHTRRNDTDSTDAAPILKLLAIMYWLYWRFDTGLLCYLPLNLVRDTFEIDISELLRLSWRLSDVLLLFGDSDARLQFVNLVHEFWPDRSDPECSEPSVEASSDKV